MLKNFLKLFLLFPILIPIQSNASCATSCIPYEQRINYTREPFNNYDDEGDMRFKLRALGAMFSKSQVSDIPPAFSSTYPLSERILKSGFGLEGAINYFVTNNIAIELALSLIYCRKHISLSNLALNKNKGISTYIIPLTATGQYHIAPYGGIQPYLGAGYHIAYILSKANGLRIRNHYGPVIQAGIDFVYQDFNLINFDIKQYFATPDIIFPRSLVNKSIRGKLKTNPLVFSMGMGFRF